MFKDIERVIEAALELPPDDRVRVAEKILESVPEFETKADWMDEVERRKAEWDSGAVEGIDSEEAIRRLKDITS